MPGKKGNFCSFLNGRAHLKSEPGTNYTLTWPNKEPFGKL